jgi:hypothetical protein
MALTIGTQKKYTVGGRWQTSTAITADSSYPAGGWSLTPTQLGLPLGFIDNVFVVNAGVTAVGALNLQYDVANQKLMAFAGGSTSAVQAEITATTDIHTSLANTVIVATGK